MIPKNSECDHAVYRFKDLQTSIKHKVDKAIQNVLAHGKYTGTRGQNAGGRACFYADNTITNASGTDALLMAEMALGIGRGDEVITTPLTWVSTVETIQLLGAKTVFVDIDPRTYNLDANLIEAAITDKTKAIVPVSLYGNCCDMTAINRIAEKYDLAVIEDGAQSFGATHAGKRSGSMSTVATTSFFPAKPLGCYGDGGACFTDDDELAEKIRWIRVHGQKARHDIQLVGINGRLDTMQAAILLEKFAIFPGEVERRQQAASWYNESLSGYVETPYLPPENTSVYAQYTIRDSRRDKIQAELKERGIPSVIYYPKPAHVQPAYAELGYKLGDFPVTERAVTEIFSIPMHPYLTTDQVEEVASTIKNAIKSERMS